MSKDTAPLVSIGMPVHNGEDSISDALDSILDQTYRNFEIIISDNASSDDTETICRAYVARDSRIRYIRNQENIGAARNFNRLVELAQGDLFKWAAHDDLIAPQYLQRCVDLLIEDASLIWSHTRCVNIDRDGELIQKRHWDVDFHSWLPQRRFADAILVNHECLCVFGVIRMSALKQTDLIGSYVASDRTLVAQLCLLGRYGEVPIDAFLHREHDQRSTVSHAGMKARQRWFDPQEPAISPNRALFGAYRKAVVASNIGKRAKAVCFLHLLRWVLNGGQQF